MAAPSAQIRLDPSGFLLTNGYQALIAIGDSGSASIALWEKDVGVPGIDGGDPIDTTTQQNDTWRTFAPKRLKTMQPFTVVCGYDPCVYDDLIDLVNLETTFTIYFPGDSTLTFYGYLRMAEFSALKDGEFPECTITIVPTNYDPTHCVEAGPVLSCAGTC